LITQISKKGINYIKDLADLRHLLNGNQVFIIWNAYPYEYLIWIFIGQVSYRFPGVVSIFSGPFFVPQAGHPHKCVYFQSLQIYSYICQTSLYKFIYIAVGKQ